MRYVFENRQAAKEVGKRARQHIVTNYSREVVANKILAELQRLDGSRSAG